MGDEQSEQDRGSLRGFRRAFGSLLGTALALSSLLGIEAVGSTPAAAALPLQPVRGIQGQVPPGATLVGPAPTTATLPLVVTLEPRDPAALAAEAQAVSTPGSAQFRHFLAPAQFAQQYGPTPATIAAVTAALRSQGLTVGQPAATGLSVPVSGTVAQVQAAFATPIDTYRLSSGKTGYRNRSTPEVPATVQPQIQGILGLDTLSPPQPSSSVPQAATGLPHAQTQLAAPAPAPALAPGQPTPQPGTCATSIAGTGTGALDADQLAQAYSLDPLYSSSSNPYGSGSTVALVELGGAGYLTSDITTFANCYGITLGGGQISTVDVDGGSQGDTGGGTVESELDIETVLSLAPKANIKVYEGENSLYDVFNKIVSDDTAKIVSASWTNGCEAYTGSAEQSSENTVLQAGATEGQSIFVATGDQGAEGCNINGAVSSSTGSDPVAQAVDPSTGTLYVANKSSNTVTVDSEGSPGNFPTAASVTAGTGPDAVALDASVSKVFVANGGSTSSLTVIPTGTCNASTTSGCSSPTQVASGGHLSSPAAITANGSTLYVGNANGTVAVYNAITNAFVATLTLLTSTVPTALAVDATNGFVYVADGSSHTRVEYFNAATCNATTTSGCSTAPTSITVGNDPVSLAVDGAAGNLYVGNAGSGGGISVVSLNTHAVTATISTSQPQNGTGLVQSIGLSPDTNEVLAVLTGLGFPGDVMATINPSSNAITATVGLENGSDAMGQLVSDGTRDYVWMTDETNADDVVQNLNLAVSDPASQPYVTAVGGTTVTALGPAPTEKVWNDQLNYSEGAGGGGISATFTMPAYQQTLGTVTGSTGTPCADSGGDCREVPDVSADADPSTGYIVYDGFNGYGWTAFGGTSGAAPLWAAVLADVASANGNTAGYGALNPALYLLAQQSPGTYLNDVTSGNNDYNATNSGQFPAMTGYDMATGLGTPVASALATGLTAIPLDVVVSGTQTYNGSPTFSATANYAGSGTAPYGVTLNTSALTCTTVGTSTPIGPTLPVASYTLLASSCSGLTLGGVNAGDYSIITPYTTNGFTVTPAPVNVAVTGSQTYGGTSLTFFGADSPPTGITVNTSALTCTKISALTFITATMAAGTYPLLASSCSGATLSGTNEADYAPAYTATSTAFTVNKAPLTVTASSGTMTYGGTVPTITAMYSGFKNSDSASSLSPQPTCSTTATSGSPVLGSPYATSCGGAADPNYTISYTGGSVTVTTAALTITASSASMTYGGSVPTITAGYGGFKNGDTASSLGTQPTCSTTATGSSPAGSYPSSCSGAVDSNYAVSYVNGSVTVGKAALTITAGGGTFVYGGTVPTITPGYSGFVNGDNSSSLSTPPTCSTTATSASPVGSYPSSCSGAVDPNYTIGYTAGSVSVTKAPLTITASSPSMTYGGSVPTITAGYGGFKNGDTAGSLTTQPTCVTTATGASPVGSYPSSCSGAADPNYTISYTAGSVTVNKAPLSITASSSGMTYGGTPPGITPGYSGFVNGDTASSLSTPPTCSTTATSASPVGSYPSSCSGAVDPNYTIAYTAGSVSVAKAPLTITASSPSMTYGGSVPTITAGYGGFKNGDTASSLSPQPTCSTTATGSSPAGSYPSSCSGAADSNYSFTYVSGSVTVGKAALTITASNGSMTYGGTVPGITAGYGGFVNGDTATSLSTPPTCSTTATSASPVGSYPSSCSGAVDPNYTIGYTAGSVSVTKAPLTITASSPSMTYGGSVPTITAGYGGFKNGDTAGSLTTQPTCVTTATTTSTVSLSPYPSSCSGAVDANYTMTYVAGSVSVTPAGLTVTASSGSMAYGSAPPAVTAQYAGFKNSDNASSLSTQPTCSTTATSSSAVGSFPSSCSGAADPNYTIGYVNGSVSVTKAPLTITASSSSMVFGGMVPVITPIYTGFVNGDSAPATAPVCSTTATSSSPVGSYPSSCSGAADPNYAFTYVNGSVSVGSLTLSIQASSATMTYGGSVPTITPSYSGFKSGDSASSLTTQPTCSTLATSASAVSGSPYASSCSGAVDPNYTFVYVNGAVTVNQAPLIITASSPSISYGSSPPTIVAGYAGFKNGDGPSSLSPQPSCSTSVTSSSPVGTYPTSDTCSGASDPNYMITYADGATTVNPEPVNVAVRGSQTYGSGPNFSSTVSPPAGVTVDTIGVHCTEVSPGTPITTTMADGSYTLVGSSCSGASITSGNAADYTVTYSGNAGGFTVTGQPPPPPPPPPPPLVHGYWLVGSDGGIFTFGSALFHGSTGNLVLQRPVVGITPTADEGGYWLVASDGGIFAFGDSGYYGSIPGDGLHPAGSGVPNSLNAPIVGMVPSSTGGGYFMVASDGGVFAFGDARFEGSCPGIGGCSGAAVAVVPDASGNGYWLVTQTGHVYTFGDAPYYGAPGTQGAPVTSAARTADGHGYYILLADGTVYAYGDALPLGSAVAGLGGLDPASSVFTDHGGGGYWVASAAGAVFTFGDAPNDGSMAGAHLNGAIIAATGF